MSNDSKQLPLELWHPTQDERSRLYTCINALRRSHTAPDERMFLQDITAVRDELTQMIDGRRKTGKAGVR